jgi:hypothetical protein
MILRIKYFLLLLFAVNKLTCQVVFAPKGAEWCYNFWESWGTSNFNVEKITYLRDSVIGNDTVKLLKSKRVFRECDNRLIYTLIKQKGDTIYFKNASTQQWQILYNMAALPGEKWNTMMLFTNNTLKQYTVTVLSVGSTTVNGFSLKKQHVQYEWSDPGMTYTTVCDITERFGCSLFMYNYFNQYQGFCDADAFYRFLCYKDSVFPQTQFTSYPCDYTSGIEENVKTGSSILAYPNPNNGSFTIKLPEGRQEQNVEISMFDITGRLISKENRSITNGSEIGVKSDLKDGMYLLKVKFEGGSYDVHHLIISR